MPWNPYRGLWEPGPPTNGGAQRFTGQPMYAGTLPATKKGGYDAGNTTRLGSNNQNAAAHRYVGQSLLPQERGREAAAAGDAGAYRGALGDIGGTVDKFSDIYKRVGQAISDPAMRDFQQTLARTDANVASRFGGNVSGEELRQGYNTSDVFTRNLSEALARTGGEQVNSALNYTNQLGGAAAQSASERDRLQQMILQALGLYAPPKVKKGVGDYLGAAVGGAAAGIPGIGGAVAKGIVGGGI